MFARALAFFVLTAAVSTARAQEAINQNLPALPDAASIQSAPNSAWLDLRQTGVANSKMQTAPAWVEQVSLNAPAAKIGAPQKTTFRIRVTRPAEDARVLLFRLFFDDTPHQQPELIAWDESGSQVLRSGPLGEGIALSTSATVMVPMIGVTAIDLEVPGDGKNVRGAFLDWMKTSEVLHPVSAEKRALIPEPFAATAPLRTMEGDHELFGAVTAPLAAETIRIGPSVENGAAFQFGIETQPLLALLSFEVASPDVSQPPEVFLNGERLGAAAFALPDLADPAYRGRTTALAPQMHFDYTGWLRAQLLVPAAALKVGTNDLLVVSGAGTPVSAIRAVQIQLKYLWEKSDYILQPSR
jgi:hypothetical protein